MISRGLCDSMSRDLEASIVAADRADFGWETADQLLVVPAEVLTLLEAPDLPLDIENWLFEGTMGVSEVAVVVQVLVLGTPVLASTTNR